MVEIRAPCQPSGLLLHREGSQLPFQTQHFLLVKMNQDLQGTEVSLFQTSSSLFTSADICHLPWVQPRAKYTSVILLSQARQGIKAQVSSQRNATSHPHLRLHFWSSWIRGPRGTDVSSNTHVLPVNMQAPWSHLTQHSIFCLFFPNRTNHYTGQKRTQRRRCTHTGPN